MGYSEKLTAAIANQLPNYLTANPLEVFATLENIYLKQGEEPFDPFNSADMLARAFVISECLSEHQGGDETATAMNMVRTLETRGEAIVEKLIENNRGRIGTISEVQEKFGFSDSDLRKLIGEGRVICYCPKRQTDFLFPLDQFEHGAVRDWAASVVDAIGNGGGAFHFVFVPREDIGGVCLIDVCRQQPIEAEKAIRKAIDRLVKE